MYLESVSCCVRFLQVLQCKKIFKKLYLVELKLIWAISVNLWQQLAADCILHSIKMFEMFGIFINHGLSSNAGLHNTIDETFHRPLSRVLMRFWSMYCSAAVSGYGSSMSWIVKSFNSLISVRRTKDNVRTVTLFYSYPRII